jgi:hypothetical protein
MLYASLNEEYILPYIFQLETKGTNFHLSIGARVIVFQSNEAKAKSKQMHLCTTLCVHFVFPRFVSSLHNEGVVLDSLTETHPVSVREDSIIILQHH